MSMLKGKKALIIGIASKLSLATGIASAFHREGAELALTYQNDRLKKRVVGFAEQFGGAATFPLDVSDDRNIATLFDELAGIWDGVDIIIHSVGFAPASELDGDFVDVTSREGFNTAHEISSYSFTALAREGRRMMQGRNGALLTLSYLGALKTVPNYNVMGLAKASLEANVRYMASSLGPEGIRVNGISAGPIKTLASSGVSGIRRMLAESEARTPLRRNVTIEEVGNTAAFLCSDLSSGITGEIIYVDGGFNSTAMSPL